MLNEYHFYEMQAAGKLPQTSQINVAEYAEFFDGLKETPQRKLWCFFQSVKEPRHRRVFLL